ncbi:PP2C family protein-serine/threonine phosphatase [Streptomyces sp. NPDC048197]|uniref:PP2C family protein-serine/threonine phosphatase n=1 Tax=Streptomyces sp. NPDC048197 TaxID=3365511 RepID=UPI0037105498
MGLRRRFGDLRQPWQASHALVLIPLVLIAVITLVDIMVPADVHLGPLLVVAPALTASFAGPRLTGFVGALAVLAQAYIGLHFGVLFTERNVMVQVLALAALSALIVFFCVVRERHRQELAKVRSVAEAAQKALLRPLPHRIGPLHIASCYLAAEQEAAIGGDLYTATRTTSGTRLIIGDVRGKGLAAIGESALLLGAFREMAHQDLTLPALAAALDRSVCRYLTDFIESDRDIPEHFITALLLEIPDEGPATRMTDCGHPPPLLLSQGHVSLVPSPHPAPPLGMGGMGAGSYPVDGITFEFGDTLLLYTDGVTEARDRHGTFYPLTQRVARWPRCDPEALLHHIHRDLLAHCSGHLGDDAALIAIQRTPVPQPRHRLGIFGQTDVPRW